LTIDDKFLDENLAGDAFLAVNWNLINRFGVTKAAILAFLLSQRRRARSMGILDDAGGFHTPLKYQSVKLKLSEKTISNHIKEMGFVKVLSKGMPKQNFYYIDSSKQSGRNYRSERKKLPV